METKGTSLDSRSVVPPSYAFPALYPPQCSDDPFPCRYGDTTYIKAKLPHRDGRKSSQSLGEDSIDVQTLISAFEKLEISEDRCEDASIPAETDFKTYKNTYLSPFEVHPPRAPLVSLVLGHTQPYRQEIRRKIARQKRKFAISSNSPEISNQTISEDSTITTLYTLTAGSEDSLPSLSYSSGSDLSDDGCSQDLPDPPHKEQCSFSCGHSSMDLPPFVYQSVLPLTPCY